MVAAERGYDNSVELLLKMGADVNNKSMSNETGLHCAAQSGHEKCVSLLINAGANVNVRDCNGITPLMIAALNGHDKCVSILVKARADVNMRSLDRFTPLMGAARNDHDACVDVLINAGADVNARADGFTAYHWALEENHNKCQELLYTASSKGNRYNEYCYNPCMFFSPISPLIFSIQNGQIECFKQLIQTGADVNITTVKNIKCDDGTFAKEIESPLICAVKVNEIECVKCLLQEGAHVNSTMKGYRNLRYPPLLQVVVNNERYVLKHVLILLNAGAKINTFHYKIVAMKGQNYIFVNRRNYHPVQKKALDVLFAAGEDDDRYGNVPDYLPDVNEINLKHICREGIRQHLLELDPHENLFVRVPEAGTSVCIV